MSASQIFFCFNTLENKAYIHTLRYAPKGHEADVELSHVGSLFWCPFMALCKRKLVKKTHLLHLGQLREPDFSRLSMCAICKATRSTGKG